jgi:hypothetical protein
LDGTYLCREKLLKPSTLTMRVVIKVARFSYGYVVCINGSTRAFTNVLGSHHPETAAEAALAAWQEHRGHPDGVTMEVSPEVLAIIASRGPVPWEIERKSFITFPGPCIQQ